MAALRALLGRVCAKAAHPELLVDEGEFEAATAMFLVPLRENEPRTQLRHRECTRPPYKWFYGSGSFIVDSPYLEGFGWNGRLEDRAVRVVRCGVHLVFAL